MKPAAPVITILAEVLIMILFWFLIRRNGLIGRVIRPGYWFCPNQQSDRCLLLIIKLSMHAPIHAQQVIVQ